MNMKKTFLPLCLSALMLVSCGGGTSSTPSSSASASASASQASEGSTPSAESSATSAEPSTPGTSQSSSQIETLWSPDDVSLMKNCLYGEVLPYPDIELTDITLNYDIDERTLYITADDLEGDGLENYSLAFEAEGWVGGDFSEVNDLPEGTLYMYEKSVDTDDGERFLRVFYYGMTADEEDPEYSTTGVFYLNAFDPYVYEFPVEAAQTFAYYVSSLYLDEPSDYDVPPAFEADYYEVNDRGAIYCYGENPTGEDDAGYSATLTAAGWTVFEERDEYDYFVALSPEGDYQVSYLYSFEYGSLDIYFEEYAAPEIVYDAWQPDVVAEFFELYEATPFDFPAIDVEGGAYTFVDSPFNAFAYFLEEYEIIFFVVTVENAKPEDCEAYFSAAQTAGWEVEPIVAETGVTYNITKPVEGEDQQYHLSLVYDEENEAIQLAVFLYPEALPYSAWPTDLVNENLANMFDATDTLPAYEGEAEGFEVNGNVIDILVGEGNEEAAIAAYAKLLLDNGYVYHEDEFFYYSPNDQFRVSLNVEAAGVVTVYVTDLPEVIPTFEAWPSEVLADFYEEGWQDKNLPAITGASLYRAHIDHIGDDDVFGYVECVYQEGDYQAIIANYGEALLAAGFYKDAARYGEHYVSPHADYVVSMDAMEYEDSSFSVFVRFDNLVDGEI